MSEVKLSKAQQKVIDEARREIDDARRLNYEDWMRQVVRHPELINDSWFRRYYADSKCGIVFTHCNGRTLKRLESLGLIEILCDGTNKRWSYDKVKLLNY